MNSQMLFGIVLTAFPVLLSLTLHEFGHARVALAFGDDTARLMGRVSLNPLVHLDPVGTLAMFLTPVGWAKPVPVNPANLRRRWGNFCVSIAGISMNLLLGGAAVVALNILAASGFSIPSNVVTPTPAVAMTLMLIMLLTANVSLAVFNLVPLAPLDGHHVLGEMLPPEIQRGYVAFQQRMGRPLLIGLMLLSVMSRSGGPSINPLGTLMNWTARPLMHLVLTDQADHLVRTTLQRFHGFLLR